MTRRRQMGDLFSDLASQSTEFTAAWGTVQSQLSQEGATQLDVVAAKQSLANSFQQIVSNPQGFGLSTSDALKAATDFTVAGRTVLGAVDHVQGLIAAAQGGDPTQAFQMFTGTLIGGAVAAGALSAGIGSVIVIGVGAALSLMKDAGLFGAPPQGQQICTNLWINPPPTLQVGCVGSSASAIKNGSPYWRNYPKRSGGNAGDDQWFSQSFATWSGSKSGPMASWGGYSTTRLIDSAFPDAHYLACQSVPGALASFNAAFLAAWTANKEYELNGLKSQPDWQVLQHLATVWNRAHSNASTYDVTYVAKPYLQGVSLDPATGKIDGPCPSNLPPYVATLISDLVSNLSSNDPLLSAQGALRLHTGPLVTPPKRVITLRLPPKPAPVTAVRATPWTASPAAPSSGASTAIAVAALAVAGAGAFYVYRQKKRRKPIVPPKVRARAQKLRRALHF
jgi:hypothetical protein